MPQFAANLSMMYTELPFMQRFAAAAQDGFKAVEYLFPYAFSKQALAQELKAHDLQQVLFNAPPGGVDAASISHAWDTAGDRGTAAVPGREDEFKDGVLLALDYAEALACPRIHLMAGLIPTVVTREQAQATYIANLRWAASLASRRRWLLRRSHQTGTDNSARPDRARAARVRLRFENGQLRLWAGICGFCWQRRLPQSGNGTSPFVP